MNIKHLRRALKSEWLTYYRSNRDWIIKLGIWVNCQGQRRPSASFILGVISTLDPQLTQLLPLVVDLNCNPDQIVLALGLNFNPEDELTALEKAESPRSGQANPPLAVDSIAAAPKLLPSSSAPVTTGQTTPYLEPAPAIQPSTNPFAQADLTQSEQLDQSESDNPKPNNSQTNGPVNKPAVPAKPTRRPLDTAQLNARELPDRDTSPRRSRRRTPNSPIR